MNVIAKLFQTTKKRLNEDEGYSDHMVGQENGPFYCGTAFCGHNTKAAARKCWKDKCDAIARIRSEAEELRKSGKIQEANRLESTEIARYYPEQNPLNWPCNRSSREMQREYIEKAKRESGS